MSTNLRDWLETPLESFNIVKKDHTLIEMYYERAESSILDVGGDNTVTIQGFNVFKSNDSFFALSDSFHKTVANPDYEKFEGLPDSVRMTKLGNLPPKFTNRLLELERFRYYPNKFHLFDNGKLYYIVPNHMLETELTIEQLIKDYEDIFTEATGSGESEEVESIPEKPSN